MTDEYYATDTCQTCNENYEWTDQSPEHCKLGFCSLNCYKSFKK